MTEYHRGGYIGKSGNSNWNSDYIRNNMAGCGGIGYVITTPLAEKYRDLLDKLNEGEYTSVEDVDETDSGQEDL